MESKKVFRPLLASRSRRRLLIPNSAAEFGSHGPVVFRLGGSEDGTAIVRRGGSVTAGAMWTRHGIAKATPEA